MKIIRAFPPIYNTLIEHFPIKGKPGILYAWGDRIYNPSGVTVPEWLIAHEEVHGERQCGDCIGSDSIIAWWQRYIYEPAFRLNEEVPAHQKEWQVVNGMKIPEDTKERYLAMMAHRLSGPLYNHMITDSEAVDVIQRSVA